MFYEGRARDWFDCHGLLNKPVKEFTAISRDPEVEPERIFIKVIVQMLMTDSALMSAQQPSP